MLSIEETLVIENNGANKLISLHVLLWRQFNNFVRLEQQIGQGFMNILYVHD